MHESNISSSAPAYDSLDSLTAPVRAADPVSLSDAVILLHGDGRIRQASRSAGRILNLDESRNPSASFFALVHPMHLYQVMKDVSDMVCRGKKQASWLLRLRTGRHQWRWFKVVAQPSHGPVDEATQFSVLLRGPIDEYAVSD